MEKAAQWRQRPYPAIIPILVLLILLAYGLRLVNLDAFSFWTDEGLTPLRSGYPMTEILSNRIIIQEGITKDTHPAFYYLIIHFTRQLWGTTDFAFRYPSLLAGLLLVPLLYQFGRRLGGVSVGVLAALLTAINPLQIYYGNEARMYTLLVLFLAVASYLLWRALQGADLRRYLLLYIIFAGLALYTHYTAVFLIASQGLFWVWLLWQHGFKKLLGATAVAAILLAIPLIPVTVPRLFTGTEANYYYVQPQVMLQDVLHFFGMGLTSDFKIWAIKLLDLFMLALLVVGLWAAGAWRKRAFLLLYLLAIVFGLMAGSLLKPMYQGVRHIMAGSPAFLLLLALGMGTIISVLQKHWSKLGAVGHGQETGPEQNGVQRQHTAVTIGLSLAGILLFLTPLAASFVSLNNLYNDTAYAKGDFRGLIRYIEGRAGENDVIVYNDAILLPLHSHYQQRSDVDVTALPIYPYPVDAKLALQMDDLAAQYDRIWFINGPPADGRDAQKEVRNWLDTHLPVVDAFNITTEGAAVSTVGFATADPTISQLPAHSQALDIAWPDLPRLHGIEKRFSEPATTATLWVDLFWDGAFKPSLDKSLRFSLRGPDGTEWLRSEQGMVRNTSAWPTTDLVRQSYKVAVPGGTPPATYTLLAQPLTAEGAELGDNQELGTIELAATQRPLPGTSAIIFANGLILHAIELYDTAVYPGHTLPLNLHWQSAPDAEFSLPDLRYKLEVVAPDGQVLRDQKNTPGASWLETWPTDSTLREKTALYIYPEAPPGRYQLRWQLQAGDEGVAGRPFWRPWFSDNITVGAFDVQPWPLETQLPTNVTQVGAEFGPAMQLYGYEVATAVANNLSLTLIWQAAATPSDSYLIFVHLLDGQGNIISQMDRVPVDGLRPTSGWRAGELLTDSYLLPLPPDLLPADYQINIGVYNSENGQRLPVLLDGQPQLHDQLSLTKVTLP